MLDRTRRFLFGPDGRDIDGCFRESVRLQLAFAQQRRRRQSPVLEEQDFDGLRLRRDHPNFGNAEAFVILQFFSALGAGVGGGKHFDDEFGGGVDVAVAARRRCFE